jgi:histidine ammonia-lyase/phenylalanine ammonia-lyase
MIAGRELTLDNIVAVARSAWNVQLSQEIELQRALHASVELKEELIARGDAIYGVTTGFGDSSDRQVSHDRVVGLQHALIDMMGCGTGPYAPEDEARATTLIRANCLARGHSGVRREVIERLLGLLNAGAAPAIREQGSVGASGDLVPLSYVAAALRGKRNVFHRGKLRPARDLLAELGVEPLDLEAKEALSLLNGTAFMAGITALAAYDAQTIALTADLCTALCTEVLHGLEGPFAPFLHDVAKPHRGQVRSAKNIRAFLSGSAMTRSESMSQSPSSAQGVVRLPARVQDSYSIRCAPHFIGALWDTLDWVEQWLVIEINSTTDNPLFDVETGTVANGGNFAGSHVGLAADALRTAVASVADLIDRQMALIVDEKFSNGLPANLAAPVPDGHPQAGIRHALKGLQIACSSLVADAQQLCMPATAFSRSTECHNQDKVSMATIAARRTRDVVRLTENVLACHLVALCQAAELRGRNRLGQTRSAVEAIRQVSAPLQDDRELEFDLEAVVHLIRARRLVSDHAPAASGEHQGEAK